MKNINSAEQLLSALRSAYDSLEIITTATKIAEREFSKIERKFAFDNSFRTELKIIERDVISMQSEVADLISNRTDEYNQLLELSRKTKEKNREENYENQSQQQ